MAMNFKTFEDFNKWRVSNNINMSQEDINKIAESLGKTDKASLVPEVVPQKKVQSNWIVTTIALILILIGGVKTTSKVLKLMT